MNILTDKLAERGNGMMRATTNKRPVFSTTVLALYTHEDIQVLDIRRYMLNKVNGKRMKEYYERRRGWSEEVIEIIEWEGIEGMLRSARPI